MTTPPCLLTRKVITKQVANDLEDDAEESVISEPELLTTVVCRAPNHKALDLSEADVQGRAACSGMFRTSSFLLDGVSISGGTLGNLRVDILNQVLLRETRSRFNGISCSNIFSMDSLEHLDNESHVLDNYAKHASQIVPMLPLTKVQSSPGRMSDTTPASLYEMTLGDAANTSEPTCSYFLDDKLSLNGGSLGTLRRGLLKTLWQNQIRHQC